MLIAQSKLWFKKGRGERRPITFTIGKPEKDPLPSGAYRCPVTIRGRKQYVGGYDSIQSLMLATVYLNLNIHFLYRHGYRFFMSKSGKMRWTCDWCGKPIARNWRD